MVSAFDGLDGRNGPDGRCANPNDLISNAMDCCYLGIAPSVFIKVFFVRFQVHILENEWNTVSGDHIFLLKMANPC